MQQEQERPDLDGEPELAAQSACEMCGRSLVAVNVPASTYWEIQGQLDFRETAVVELTDEPRQNYMYLSVSRPAK